MTKPGRGLGKRKGDTRWGDIADVMERVMWDEKQLFPNVDFPAAYAYYLMGDRSTPRSVARGAAGSGHPNRRAVPPA